MRFSLEGKFALLSVLLILLANIAAAALFAWLNSPFIAALVAALLVIPLAIFAARIFMRPITRTLQALSDGITSMKDRDFSVSITPSSQDELPVLDRKSVV